MSRRTVCAGGVYVGLIMVLGGVFALGHDTVAGASAFYLSLPTSVIAELFVTLMWAVGGPLAVPFELLFVAVAALVNAALLLTVLRLAGRGWRCGGRCRARLAGVRAD